MKPIGQLRASRQPKKVTVEIEKRADALSRLADYHRKAMEARRTVGFRGLVAVFALNGAILFKAQDLFVGAKSPDQLRVVISTFAICVLLAFLHTTYEIEKRNEMDRRKYASLESEAWRLLDPGRWAIFYTDFTGDSPDFVPKRSLRQSINAAWAATGPIVASILLLTITLLQIW